MRILILFFTLFCSTFSFAQVDKSNYSLLWEISGNKLEKKSYLFGTMHVQDERAHEFSDSTLVCLDATDVYAMEVNFDSIMTDITDLYLEEDTTNVLKAQLSPEAYARLNQRVIAKLGVPIDSLPNRSPAFIEEALSDFEEPEYTVKKPQPVDLYLMKRAVEQGHAVHGLEELSDYEGVTQRYFEQFEREGSEVAEVYNVDSMYEVMLQLYRRGDIEAMYKDVVDDWEDSDYGNEMLNKRNVNMVLELEKLMLAQSVFCAVGTAHLPGKLGMIEELRRKGYVLRRVLPTFEGYANKYEKTVEKSWGIYTDEVNYFSIQVPGDRIPLDDMVGNLGEGAQGSMFMDIMDMHIYMEMVIPIKENINSGNRDKFFEGIIARFSNGNNEKLLRSKEVERSGVRGKRLYTTDGESQKAWEVFTRGKQIYLFVVLREEGEIEEENVERFCNSITFQKPEWKNYNYATAAYRVDLPMPAKVKRVVRDMSQSGEKESELISIANISVDPITGMTYLVRQVDTQAGMIVNDIDKALFTSIDKLNETLGDPVAGPIPTVVDGQRGFKLQYNLKATMFDVYAVRRGCREIVLGVEYPKGGLVEADAERFLSSFKFQPFQQSEFKRSEFPDAPCTMAFPGEVKIFRDTFRGYPILDNTEYFALDTMYGGSFEVNAYRYNEFYTPTKDDDYYVDFYGSLRNSNEPGEIRIDTIFQGCEASYAVTKKDSSDSRIIELTFHDDLYMFDMIVILPDEIDDKVAWRFFNSFENKTQKRKNYLKTNKKAALFKALENTTDSSVIKMTRAAMQYMSFENSDLAVIYDQLEKKSNGDLNDEESVERILLREFKYTSDNTTVPFLQKLFKEKQGNRLFQKAILETLTGMRTEESFDAFFGLANDFPKDKEVTFQYNSMFSGLKDSLILTGKYMKPLFEQTEDISFRYYVYDMLAFGCNNDTTFVRKLKPYLPRLLADAERIVVENSLSLSNDTLPDFPEYYHFDKLNFIFTFFGADQKAIGDYFTELKEIPDVSILGNVVDGLLIHNRKVPKSIFEKISESPYYWKRLLRNLEISNNVDKVPSKLYTQKRTVEAIVAYTIENEYDEVKGYKLLEVRDHTFKGEAYKVYIFTFGVKGYDSEYLGLCSQPAKGVQVEDNQFFYFTEAYIEADKEADIQQLLEAWE